MFGEVRVYKGEDDRVKAQIPCGIPRIFPFVRHGDDIAVLEMLPFMVPAFKTFRRGRRLSCIAVEPVFDVIGIQLFIPEHSGEGLPLDSFFVFVLYVGLQRGVEIIRFPYPVGKDLIEIGKGVVLERVCQSHPDSSAAAAGDHPFIVLRRLGSLLIIDGVVTAGCMEAVAMCLKAVTKPGDTVAIENPTYFGIFQVIESLGLKALEVATDPVTGIDPEHLGGLICKFPIKACVFVTNFGNPLGFCMPDEKKRALVQLLTRHRIPLIEDDIYGELYFGGSRPKNCKSFDKEGWVLYCSSLSKSLAPGYRIGWTLPGRFTEEVMRTKMMFNVTGTTITQRAIAHFLGIGRYEYHLRKLRKALHTQCLRYMQGILQYFPPGTKVSRPQGGFVLWVELDQQLNSYRLYQEALKHNVSVAPGQLFSVQGQFGNCLRISYARPWQ